MIEITENTLSRVENILAGIPNGAQRALTSAINRGLVTAKKTLAQKVQETYTASAGAIAEATKVELKKASGSDTIGFIHYSGYKIPLYKFRVTPKNPGTRKTVHATVKKGEGGDLPDAFVPQMQTSHTGVFERVGLPRLPIEEKMGLAMAQMVGNRKVTEEAEKEAQKTIEERLEHEIDRLLSGYGG